jgi:hypothetical protein
MLTDDEIKDLKALTRFADRHSVCTCDPQTVHELATRLLSAEADQRRTSEMNVTLITERDAALARVKVLEDALRPFASADWIYQNDDDWAMAQSVDEDEVERARTALQEQSK